MLLTLLLLAATPDLAELKIDRRGPDGMMISILADGLNAAPLSRYSTKYDVSTLTGEARAALTLQDTKLVEVKGRMRFADKALEAKPKWWKFCFRAGPEATKAARDFATAWLAELNAPPSPAKLSDEK